MLLAHPSEGQLHAACVYMQGAADLALQGGQLLIHQRVQRRDVHVIKPTRRQAACVVRFVGALRHAARLWGPGIGHQASWYHGTMACMHAHTHEVRGQVVMQNPFASL